MLAPTKIITYTKKAARQQFSEMIREVQGGVRIVITYRGTPLVDVVPHERGDAMPTNRKRPPLIALKAGSPSLADELETARGGR